MALSTVTTLRSEASLRVKLLRRELRRGLHRFRSRQLSFAEAPIFFGNSFPKSGTHLLTQVLDGFTRLGPAVNSGLPAVTTFIGSSGEARPVEAILGDLRRFKPGDIGYGHLHAMPELVSYLCQDGFASFFILRDPRDVAVSHVHYVTHMAPGHAHHRYYRDSLHTFDQRLHTSIAGRPQLAVSFPDIAKRFEPYLGWLDCPGVLVLRYEDFIREQDATLRRVLDHAVGRGFRLSAPPDLALGRLAQAIDPDRSPTYREGKVGGWRGKFSPAHKKAFKDYAGDLLIRLGYEKDYAW